MQICKLHRRRTVGCRISYSSRVCSNIHHHTTLLWFVLMAAVCLTDFCRDHLDCYAWLTLCSMRVCEGTPFGFLAEVAHISFAACWIWGCITTLFGPRWDSKRSWASFNMSPFQAIWTNFRQTFLGIITSNILTLINLNFDLQNKLKQLLCP